MQERVEAGEKRAVIVGEVLAYRGRYADAARSFHSVGRDERALNLYVDLRMFNKAQVTCQCARATDKCISYRYA